ncbi:MAG: energy transducer TonB, partial [Roseomonas sp.]|nr:energy transducer TonB [Roseomonas sp.]
MPRALPDNRLNKWLMLSAGLHAALLIIGALFTLARSIPEPQEQGIAVELVAPGPAQMARADTPSPNPAQTSTPAPTPPTPEPPAPE